MCKHTNVTKANFAFSGPVSRNENPRAHGGALVIETCTECGAQRRTNVNQQHREQGAWEIPGGASAAEEQSRYFSAYANAFTMESRRLYHFRVDGGALSVFDDVAGHYTTCNALTTAEATRLIENARL